MDKVLKIYTNILKEYLSMCFANQQSIDPVELNKERFTVKGVFIAAIIFMKNNPEKEDRKITSAANYWFKNFFADKNLFSFIIEGASKNLTKLIDKNLYDIIEVESIDIPTYYETLLSIETGNENNGTIISTAKNYRNKLGSYYTPADLAKSVTEKTIDSFFELNFGVKKVSAISSDKLREEILKEISTMSFADFSCGSGNFLIEVIYFFEKMFYKLKLDEKSKANILKSIALNISAFDVDCLALEVAKISLLLRIHQPTLYKTLEDNFIHANFLLQSDNTVDEAKKIEIFSSGFIYHEQLALQKSNLKKYDVILGNPPWEKIRFEEKKFYALYTKNIANNHFKESRSKEIIKTELSNVQLAEFSKRFKLEVEKAKSELKKNNFFSLSHNGELNTFALFTDAAVKLKTNRGVVGLVLKSAIVTSQVNQNLFKKLTKKNLVVAIYDFINRKKIFNIDSRERFCFLLLGSSKKNKFLVVMNLNDVEEIEKNESEIELSYEDLKLMNPFTGMLPNFSSKKESDFLLRVSKEFPFFKRVFNNVRFGRIVHLTNHAEFIEKTKAYDNIPIYEGKFFNQFDGKYSGFNGVENEMRYRNKSFSVVLDESKKIVADYFPESRFFINQKKWFQLSKNYTEEFMLAWRSLTSATNSRTCIATILPFIPATQSVQFLTTNQNDLLYLAGLFNSVVFDFILKKKLSGIDLTQTVINQTPIPNKHQTIRINFNGSYATIKQHLSLLVFSLLKNDIRLSSLFESLELSNQYENDESRFEIIRKIDLLFMFLYKLNESEIELVLSAFRKKYSNIDFAWFKRELNKLQLNETVSSTSSTSSTFSPV
jgi:hypothetical protein